MQLQLSRETGCNFRLENQVNSNQRAVGEHVRDGRFFAVNVHRNVKYSITQTSVPTKAWSLQAGVRKVKTPRMLLGLP